MQIQTMFADDINRKINGVIKVDQIDESTEREIKEYVITRELKKHFISFFNYYGDAFAEPTDDIGVWISGFFGSGKSHFLKMLSYLLENRTINGIKTVERFREKFADDPATFMLIDAATHGQTESILFNIDIEGSINKDKTAVLRVFAKMFYNHLGFYGENLKVAKLEQFIARRGKTEEFRRVFEEKNGAPWLECRDAFAFFEDDVIDTLVEVLGMSETAAHNWFDGTETTEMSIAQLVGEIKDYVAAKPADYRLLFMVDEVGQYVGADTDLLLNLQSLVEKIGSECGGKVWVICTGQEAIDEIIKTRQDEFSRIQARFKTRLSLTSSSVDEVIQKRILRKTPAAAGVLERVYDQNDSVLRNLFSFASDAAVADIKGFSGPAEFAEDFPFVPYQFIIMQKVFAEIRKHGNSGKHLSGGERSMLSGFQEAAQKLQQKDEHALAPFYLFYDTVHGFLDGSIRRVIERCQKAADNGDGLEQQDVNVLKLLYLVRYIDDIKSNLDNLVILMADDIRTDKITLRGQVQASLDRLMRQNYIGRVGDTYAFLTDEEQDIAREIKNTNVDTAAIVERIAHMIFGDIYTAKKFRYGRYDFPFDTMVDTQTVGAVTGGMRLRFFTVAMDANEKSELRLLSESQGCAIVVLAETPYYEALESAMKIRKYVKQRNVSQLARSVQDIIRDRQDEAGRYEQTARKELENAITAAEFYVDGEHLEIKGGAPTAKLDQAMEYLVAHVYSELGLITKNADTDADLAAILNGSSVKMAGMEDNRDAAAKVEEYLEVQYMKKLPTSMADIQSRYQAIPYGWREIDVAAVVALLIYRQRVTVKYGGAAVHSDDARLPELLRRKSEIGKTVVSKKISPSAQNMRAVREFLRDYFDVMDVPEDEEGLVKFIVSHFEQRKDHYADLQTRYTDADGKRKIDRYPDYDKLENAVDLIDRVLSQQKDNIALVGQTVKLSDDLLDSKEDLQNLEGFFQSQVGVFDAALHMAQELNNDLSYLQRDEAANSALNTIRLITVANSGSANVYRRVPELNGLMQTVRAGHNALLEKKRGEVNEIVRQCMEEIHAHCADPRCARLLEAADQYFTQMKAKIATQNGLALLDGFIPQLWSYKDDALDRAETLRTPAATTAAPAAAKKQYKTVYRQAAFPAKTLETSADVDAYVERVRTYLNAMLTDCDGIKLS